MRITDLLQDYEEQTMQLSPMEDTSVKRVKELVHQKLPRRRRSKTVLLIAAVLALVGATACAVGMSLWDKARAVLPCDRGLPLSRSTFMAASSFYRSIASMIPPPRHLSPS